METYKDRIETITAALCNAQLMPVLQKSPCPLSGEQEACWATTTKPATLAANQTMVVNRKRYVHTVHRSAF